MATIAALGAAVVGRRPVAADRCGEKRDRCEHNGDCCGFNKCRGGRCTCTENDAGLCILNRDCCSGRCDFLRCRARGR